MLLIHQSFFLECKLQFLLLFSSQRADQLSQLHHRHIQILDHKPSQIPKIHQKLQKSNYFTFVSTWICHASSLVGAKISAIGPSPSLEILKRNSQMKIYFKLSLSHDLPYHRQYKGQCLSTASLCNSDDISSTHYHWQGLSLNRKWFNKLFLIYQSTKNFVPQPTLISILNRSWTVLTTNFDLSEFTSPLFDLLRLQV